MKRVRLITTDQHNGKEAISRTPLRNRYFFEGAWHEINVTVKPEILRDSQIIETIEAIFAEMLDTFDIRILTRRVEMEMFDSKKMPREATIDRQLRQLREYGKLNYEVVDEQKGLYRKLPVVSKTCAEQGKMEFQPDWKNRFVRFLKEETIYNNFMALMKLNKPPWAESLDELFEEIKGEEWQAVSHGFNWAHGDDMQKWLNYSVKWRAIYNGKN